MQGLKIKDVFNMCQNKDKIYKIEDLVKIFDFKYSKESISNVLKKSRESRRWQGYKIICDFKKDKFYFRQARPITKVFVFNVLLKYLAMILFFLIFISNSFIEYVYDSLDEYRHTPWILSCTLLIFAFLMLIVSIINRKNIIKIYYYHLLSIYAVLLSVSFLIKLLMNIPLYNIQLFFDPIVILISCFLFFCGRHMYFMAIFFTRILEILIIKSPILLLGLALMSLSQYFFKNISFGMFLFLMLFTFLDFRLITQKYKKLSIFKKLYLFSNTFKNNFLDFLILAFDNLNIKYENKEVKFEIEKGISNGLTDTSSKVFTAYILNIIFLLIFSMPIVFFSGKSGNDFFIDSYYSFFYSQNKGYCSNIPYHNKIIKDNLRVLEDNQLYQKMRIAYEIRFRYIQCNDFQEERNYIKK